MRSALFGILLFCVAFLLSACSTTTSKIDCTPGTENCECGLGDACDEGLTCQAGACQPGDEPSDGDVNCPIGTENCPCYSNQTCDFGHRCASGICVYTGDACTQGSEGCSCYPNDTCNDDLTCASGLCVDLKPDGDATDGDATDGDADGDGTDGDATDGDATDGDATDGDATDGDATDGDATDGDATDGDATDGDATDGDAIDGDLDEDGDQECVPISGSKECALRAEQWCQARHWESNCSDVQCLDLGWQFSCGDDGYCVENCSVDYGSVSSYPNLNDWTGTWGSISTMALTIGGMPLQPSIDNIMIHYALDRISVSETGNINRTSKICKTSWKTFDDETIFEDDLLRFAFPPNYGDALGVVQQQLFNAPAFQAGNTFTTDRHWEVRGAMLADQAGDALPTRQDYLNSDSRIWDQDFDAHPAMTIWFRGVINYDYYLVQRVSSAFEGTIEAYDRILGLNDFTYEEEVLAANDVNGIMGMNISKHADADRSYFRMLRLPDDADCEDVLWQSEQHTSWLYATPHMDPDYVPEDGDADTEAETATTTEIKFCETVSRDLLGLDVLCIEIDGKILDALAENCSSCETVPANTMLDLSLTNCIGDETFIEETLAPLDTAKHYALALVIDEQADDVKLVLLEFSKDLAACDQIRYQDVLDALAAGKSGVTLLGEFPIVLP